MKRRRRRASDTVSADLNLRKMRLVVCEHKKDLGKLIDLERVTLPGERIVLIELLVPKARVQIARMSDDDVMFIHGVSGDLESPPKKVVGMSADIDLKSALKNPAEEGTEKAMEESTDIEGLMINGVAESLPRQYVGDPMRRLTGSHRHPKEYAEGLKARAMAERKSLELNIGAEIVLTQDAEDGGPLIRMRRKVLVKTASPNRKGRKRLHKDGPRRHQPKKRWKSRR